MQAIAVSGEEVERLLPMDECVEVMASALETLGRGDGINLLREPILAGEWIAAGGHINAAGNAVIATLALAQPRSVEKFGLEAVEAGWLAPAHAKTERARAVSGSDRVDPY